jgi:tRNA (Thr-GGU) A37 N-methylase
MSDPIVLKPVGVVRNSVREPVDDIWGGLHSRIELDPAQFSAEALTGIDSFSHVEVLFFLDRIRDENIIRGARRPRNREDWPLMGVFAQRAKNRSKRVAVTIDGTPVIDIKPYLTGFGPKGEVREPAWAVELMSRYWG